MRIGRILSVWVVLLTAAAASAQQRPYERLRRSAAAYLGEREKMGWPYRAHYITQSPLTLWAGGQDLFFAWCKTNAGDWLADRDAIMPCHGNASVAAIGTYAAAGPLGKLAFGIQSFDDSCRIPFQCELLQGLIALRLVADENKLEMDPKTADELLKALMEAYLASLASTRDATTVFADDPWVAGLLSADSAYVECLERSTSVGQFRRAIAGTDGKPKELLQPAPAAADVLAGVLADAASRSSAFAAQLRYTRREDFRAATRDVAQRMVLRNPVSPGLKEYLVLLARPMRDADHDVILLLRQQIPSAAERAGFASRETGAPAERATADAQTIMEPAPCISAFGTPGGNSYVVRLFDPWSATLADREIKDADGLLHLARIWGTVTGLSHRQGGKERLIGDRLTPELGKLITSRAEAFITQLRDDYNKIRNDPTAHADGDLARQVIEENSR